MLNRNLPVLVKRAMQDGLHRGKKASRNPWVRLSVAALALFTFSQMEFSVQFSFGGSKDSKQAVAGYEALLVPEDKGLDWPKPQAINVANKPEAAAASGKAWWEVIRDQAPSIEQSMNLANAATAVGAALSKEQQLEAAKFSNLGFLLNPSLAQSRGIDPAVVAAKNQICFDYIKRHAATAQEEAKLFNIPASITLAQGLLESNAGESLLAKKDNNHFGIKCRNKCVGCRCANYTDDSKYDMFRIFESPWHSFREHSKLLTGERYKHLCRLPRSDYKAWAHGLKSAGYATDPRYGEKLIAIIEALNLQKFDE